MELVRKNKIFIILVTIFIIIYFVNFISFAVGTNVFRIQRDDVLFSIDSTHFLNKMYNPNAEEHIGSIVRHPLVTHFGKSINNFSSIMANYFNFDITQLKNYSIFAVIQIILGALSVGIIYLYLINVIHINKITSILVSVLYGLSTSNFIFTMSIDTFIISGFLLLLGAYTIHFNDRRKSFLIQAALGVCTIGTTVTNGLTWFVNMCVIKFKDNRFILKVCLYSTAIFLFLFLLQKSSVEIATNYFKLSSEIANRFSTNFTVFDIMKKSFYFIFVAPLFFIDVEFRTPFQTKISEQGITFVDSSSILLTIIGFIWIVALVASVVVSLKNRKVWPLIFSLLFFLAIHSIKQFGLREAFLYSQHVLYAQVLILGWGIKRFEKYGKFILVVLTGILIIQVINNVLGLMNLYEFCANVLKFTIGH
ncbi:DUF6080 domain-containing protein [Paenibacillus dendritiformis]|uniref:DUF6080 domain-containing protein n=2 Tax=Paenibacillus dendritiformis TaxID=130049 RepID=UPI00143DB279|nr:hypothetical protein [Paenibacillus dendritiformis]